MANKKISQLDPATTPLGGTEEIELVQGGVSKRVAISEVSGGSVPTLQEVTDAGRTFTETDTATDYSLEVFGGTGSNKTFKAEVTNSGLTSYLRFLRSSFQVKTYLSSTVNSSITTALGAIRLNIENTFGTNTLYVTPKSVGSSTTTYETSRLREGGTYTIDVEDIIKTSSFTAENTTRYNNNGTITVTDPTPVTNKGYIVHVISGTSTIGGVGYTAGALVYRFYDGATWVSKNYNTDLSTYATQSYADAKVADTITNGVTTIAPSQNSVFDALAKMETFVYSKSNATFGSHTGNTTETVIFSSDINAGEFTVGDFMTLMYDLTKVGTAGTATIRLRAGTAGTTADALISAAFFSATTLDYGLKRERFQFLTGNILSGIASSYTAAATDITSNTVVKQSTSLTPSNAWKLSVTVQLSNAGDTISCVGYRIGKIKSF